MEMYQELHRWDEAIAIAGTFLPRVLLAFGPFCPNPACVYSLFPESCLRLPALQLSSRFNPADVWRCTAESRNRPETEELKESYLQWLLMTGQEEKAAKLKEKEGD
eukprot:1167356-Rhodomonas_salina.1